VLTRLASLSALSVIVALLALAGCGGDETTTTVTAAADETSSTTADDSGGTASDESLSALKDEVDSLSDKTPKTMEQDQQVPPAFRATQCAQGVYVRSSNTSCAFALNVAADFFSTPSYRFYSYSPATGQTYLVRCTRTNPTLCRAGNGARIVIVY
jgi:hypothetical protein